MERFVVAGGTNGPRVILLHGLTGSPIELWPLAEGLAAAGWRVELPLWPGHGTSPGQLARTSPEELLKEARAMGREAPDAIVGFSMGGLLAMVAAASAPHPPPLVLLAPAVVMTGGARLFDRLGRLPWLPSSVLLDKGGADPASDKVAPRPPVTAAGLAALAATAPTRPVRYDRVPLSWARGLRVIRAEARRAASALTGEALALHGTADRTADASGLDRLPSWSPRVDWTRMRIDEAPHQLCTSPWRGLVADEVARFLDGAGQMSRRSEAG